jgi:hypothetical protein
MVGSSNCKPGARAALCALLLAVLAASASAPTSASASLVRLDGNIAGAPTWSGYSALAAVIARNGIAVELIDPATGGSEKLAALTPGSRVMTLGAGFALEQQKYGCDGRGCSKYEAPGIEARDLFYEPPGDTLRCLAQLAGNSCGSLNTCAYLSAVASGSLLAYPSCSGWENEVGSVVFDANTNQTRLVPQITRPLSVSGSWLVGLAAGWNPPFTGPPGAKPPPVLVEHNLLTGAEPLRIPLPRWTHDASSPYETSPAFAAVQEDGTIVYAVAAGRRTALWRASPTQPIPRLITTTTAAMGWLRELPLPLVLRDGRVAFPDDEAQVYGPRRIAIATLSGLRLGALRVIAQEGFDFDGLRLLAPSKPCSKSKSYLLAWAPGEPPPRVPGVGCTEAHLVHLRFASRQLRFELRCPGTDVGCETSEISVTGGPISLTAEGEELFPEDTERVALRLPRSAQRWLRHHPHAILTLRWGHHSRLRLRVSRLRPG